MSLILFFILSAKAEYRAFELSITNQTTNQSRVVLTTLDHLQYPMYYQIHKDETLQLVSTWMCRDRTDNFEPICPRPANTPQAPVQALGQPQQPQLPTVTPLAAPPAQQPSVALSSKP